jgi:C1A family cysteine protease
MPEEFPFRLDGYIPESEQEDYEEREAKHWDFESKLQSRMKLTTTGDVDLRPFTSPRHNQGRTGSCVAQSVIKALEIKRIMKHGQGAHVDLSVMALYYLARQLMLPVLTEYDNGTHISLACDALRRFGVCPSEAWPWDTDKLFTPPSWKAMRKAYMGRIESFYKMRCDLNIRADLVANCLRAGNPVVFGTNVGSQWRGYRKGIIGPTSNDDRSGRHATCIVGVEGDKFIVENSWGTGWGDNGFYYGSSELLNHPTSNDFWVIQAGWEEYDG